jgi:Zn-dependent protease with chaperone function/Zn-finger nucleic acid-binding protein
MIEGTSARPGPGAPLDFYEIQKKQWTKSLAVLAVLLLFAAFALGILLLIVWTAVGALSGRLPFETPGFWVRFWIVDGILAVLLAAVQYLDARKFGGAVILKRLGAQLPDRADRYHLMLENIVEEIRLAAGLPKVKAYVLPDGAVNSLAVIEPDTTPAVAVTEGMLAEFTRDELEAAVAHELAHIARGDAFVLTLVCSTANAFERLREMLEPDVEVPIGMPGNRSRAGGSVLGAVAALSSFVVHMLGLLVSRERELLADAAAVELGRSPAALARAIHKAYIRNSFVGDFNRTYGPLFIVPPRSKAEAGGFFARHASTHPPVAKRIAILAEMAHTTPLALRAQIEETQSGRERAKLVFPALAELRRDGTPPENGAWPEQSSASPAGKCPRCLVPLSASLYEGVPVKICSRCLGKLVHQDYIDRILARTEISFSPALVKRAEEFAGTVLWNPLKKQKRGDKASPPPPCPACGYGLASRPYNYQYFLPVERCLNCGRIWFDADELEILQILVERAKKN